MKKCKEGYKGQCCCNCAMQVKIMCHPSNGKKLGYGVIRDPLQIGNGSIKDQLAWGCIGLAVEDRSNEVIYMDFQHGMCELWQEREDEK